MSDTTPRMRRILLLCCCVGMLTAAASAQAPQNPALAGSGRAEQAPIPDTNPFSSEADIRAGEALFQKHCSYCHGSFGEG
jgi:mono/diheme cytochrome c family protein